MSLFYGLYGNKNHFLPRMVYWLSHHASLYGVFMFILPLLLLPLFSSSYAEVNYEGGKVLPVRNELIAIDLKLPT